jgi:hypothetical protein
MQKEALSAITVPASFEPLNLYDRTCIDHWEKSGRTPSHFYMMTDSGMTCILHFGVKGIALWLRIWALISN